MNKNIRPSTGCCFSCVMSGAHEALYNGILIISHHSCILTCKYITVLFWWTKIFLQWGVELNKWIWCSDFCIDLICNSLCNSCLKFKTTVQYIPCSCYDVHYCSYPLPCTFTNLSVEKCLDTILSHHQCPIVCWLTAFGWPWLQICFVQVWPPKASRLTN